jgi:hypothetical protein
MIMAVVAARISLSCTRSRPWTAPRAPSKSRFVPFVRDPRHAVNIPASVRCSKPLDSGLIGIPPFSQSWSAGGGRRSPADGDPAGRRAMVVDASGRHETHSTSGHMWATSQRVAAVTTRTAGVPTHRRAGQGIDRGVNLESAILHMTEATKYRFQVSVAMAQASSAIHGSDAASAHVRQHGAAQLHGRGQVHARTRSHSSSDISWSATNPSNTPAAFASLLRASSCL